MSSNYMHGNDTVAHHAANVAAIAIPVSGYALGVEPFLVLAATVLGLFWYAVLFYDRFFNSNATTITNMTTHTTVIEPPAGQPPVPKP